LTNCAQTVKRLDSVGKLIILLAVLFAVVGILLSAIGIDKAGNASCSDDKATGIIMSVIGTI
jgi:hypothetical protein